MTLNFPIGSLISRLELKQTVRDGQRTGNLAAQVIGLCIFVTGNAWRVTQ